MKYRKKGRSDMERELPKLEGVPVIPHKTGQYTDNNYPRAKGSMAEAMDWETRARLEALRAQAGRRAK